MPVNVTVPANRSSASNKTSAFNFTVPANAIGNSSSDTNKTTPEPAIEFEFAVPVQEAVKATNVPVKVKPFKAEPELA